MEYIYKKTGEIITNTEGMKKALMEVYTEDMFEASLTRSNIPVSIGGTLYVYGAVLRAVDNKTDALRTNSGKLQQKIR